MKIGFSTVEKEELTNCAILMSVWSRIMLAQGKTSYVVDAATKPPADAPEVPIKSKAGPDSQPR